jgi:hypothetical protein
MSESKSQKKVQSKGLVVVSDTPVEEESLNAWFWVLFGLTILILVILIVILVNPNFFSGFLKKLGLTKPCLG